MRTAHPGSRAFARSSVVAVLFCIALPAAAAQRTFVHSSPLGNDANASLSPPCTQAAPCRTFNVAIGVTDPGGEVVALDTAGYGTVTITKAITISAPGVYGGITAFAGDAITVNAGAADVVVLRGLTVNSLGAANGIHVQSAAKVNIEGVQISGFWGGGSGAAILVDDVAAPNQTSIMNVTVRNSGDGVRILADTHFRRFDVDGLVVSDGNNGLVVQGNANGGVRNASLTFLSNNGIRLTTTAAMQNPAIVIERSRVQNVGTAAVFAQNTAANSGCKLVITDSGIALSPYHVQLLDSGGGPSFNQIDLARATLEAFFQRAVDASHTGGGVTNVTVVDSLISSGNNRAISVDVAGGGYGALVVKNTTVRNVQGSPAAAAIYMHSGGNASADLQNNLLTHNSNGVVADSNSHVRLTGNTIVNSGPGAGLVVLGNGSMESLGNNMVRGSAAADAVPVVVAPK